MLPESIDGARQGDAKDRCHWRFPFYVLDYSFEWCAHWLSLSGFIATVEYLGKLGVLVVVVFYFAGAEDRKKQKHYQAWGIINSAGPEKLHSGGRIPALEDLASDGVSLHRVNLRGVHLHDVNLSGADLSEAVLVSAHLKKANLSGANLLRANLSGADLSEADFRGARNLTQEQLDSAFIYEDEHVLFLDDGFSQPPSRPKPDDE